MEGASGGPGVCKRPGPVGSGRDRPLRAHRGLLRPASFASLSPSAGASVSPSALSRRKQTSCGQGGAGALVHPAVLGLNFAGVDPQEALATPCPAPSHPSCMWGNRGSAGRGLALSHKPAAPQRPEARSGLCSPPPPRPAVCETRPRRTLNSSPSPALAPPPVTPRHLRFWSCRLRAPSWRGEGFGAPSRYQDPQGRCGRWGEGDTGLVTSEPGARVRAEAKGRREEQQAGAQGERGGHPLPPAAQEPSFRQSFPDLSVSFGAGGADP